MEWIWHVFFFFLLFMEEDREGVQMDLGVLGSECAYVEICEIPK